MLSFPFVVCCSLVITSGSFLTPWNVACQAPRSMGFPRKEYWNGLPFILPGDLPDPEIEPPFAIAGGLFTSEQPGERTATQSFK